MKLKYFKRALVDFYELSEEWQKEAINNLEEIAYETHYIEPLPEQNPREHILWDISQAMRINDSDFNACITISNNSAMLLHISDCMEEVKFKFV